MTLVSGQSLKQLKKGDGHLAVHSKRAAKNSHSGPLEIANVSVFVDVFELPCNPIDIFGNFRPQGC
jgi:hypothetical protein